MNIKQKLQLGTMGLAALSQTAMADTEETNRNSATNLETSLTAEVASSVLGSFGLILGAEPSATYTGQVSNSETGTFAFIQNRQKLENGETYMTLLGLGKTWDVGDLKVTTELDLYSFPDFETFAEVYVNARKNVETKAGTVSFGPDFAIALRGEHGAFVGFHAGWSKDVTEKLSVSVDNKLGYMVGNYFEVEGLGANTTAVQFNYDFNKGVSGFLKYHHTESLNDAVESNDSITAGVTVKF